MRSNLFKFKVGTLTAGISFGLLFYATQSIAAGLICEPTLPPGSSIATSFIPPVSYFSSCSQTINSSDLVAAVPAGLFSNSLSCNTCLSIQLMPNPTNRPAVILPIMDLNTSGPTIDLTPAAFQAVTGSTTGAGTFGVSYKFVPCPVTGPVTTTIMTGSNPYFLKLRFQNMRYGALVVYLISNTGQIFGGTSQSDGTFVISASPAIQLPATVKLVDVNSSVVNITINAIVDGSTLPADAAGPNGGQFPVCSPVLFDDGFESP